MDLDPGRKPLAEETPWRSSCFVPAHISADGNGYRPGEPIPAAEAIRQGLTTQAEATPLRQVCPRCKGRGTYAVPPKGHKPGCACRFCGPCPSCEGGFLDSAQTVA